MDIESSKNEKIFKDDESSIDLRSSESERNIEAEIFFSKQNLRKLDEKAFIFSKDKYTPFSIVLRKNITIINSSNFILLQEIRNLHENFNINNPDKIVLFTHQKIDYMMLYQENKFCIYNLKIKSSFNNVIFQISQLQDNELIINMKPLNNDLNLPYFLLVTSRFNVYILTIINLGSHANFENDTLYEIIKINQNEGILKRLTSYLTFSKQTCMINNIIVMNPSNDGMLFRNNTKYQNSVLLINDDYLKILEFSFPDNKIKGEITVEVNIMNLLLERIKSHSERFSREGIKKISLEDADVCFEKNLNVLVIFSIIKADEYYYIMKIRVENNYRIHTEIIKDLNDMEKENDLLDFHSHIKKTKIILNKNLREFYAIFSSNEKSFIFFYSPEICERGLPYKKASRPIDGYSPFFYGNKSYINLLFNKNILLKLYFDISTNKIIFDDMSNSFFKGLMINKKLMIKPPQNQMYDVSVNDNNSIVSEEFIRPQKSICDRIRTPSKSAFDDSESNFNDIEENMICMLTKKLKQYYDYKTGIKGIGLNSIYNIQTDMEDTMRILNNFKRESYKDSETSFKKVINKIILNIIDNESLNINNIDMSTKKSEAIIIEYLKERLEKYEIFINFLKEYKIFENYDVNYELYALCMTYFEKLNSAIKLREQENQLLSFINGTSGNSLDRNSLNSQYRLMKISYDFMEECFSKYKMNQNESSLDNNNFNKYSVYFKISTIDKYFKFILNQFSLKIKDFNMNVEDKIFLAYYFMELWNLIFLEIKRTSYFNYRKDSISNNSNNLNQNLSNNFYMGKCENIDFEHYKDFNNLRSSLWLIEIKSEFLEYFEEIFKFLAIDNKKEIISIKNNFSDFCRSIFDFVDNLIFFRLLHSNFKNSKETLKEFNENKRFFIKNIIDIDYEKSLYLAIKYRCLYSISLICNIYKCPEKLKEYFNLLIDKNETNFNEMIEYMLKVYLFLDIEKKLENLKYDEENDKMDIEEKSKIHKDDNNFNFDFFDNFCDFNKNIMNVLKKYPKALFHYNFYLKSKECSFEKSLNLNQNYWEEFLNIEELINEIDLENTLLNVFKMIKYVVNLSLIRYEGIQSDYANIELIESEFGNQYVFKAKFEKLNNLIDKVNFYQMHYSLCKKLEIIDYEKKQKYIADRDNIENNFDHMIMKLERNIIAKTRSGDFDVKNHFRNENEMIKKILNILFISIQYHEILKINIFTKRLVYLLILIDYVYFIKNKIMYNSTSDYERQKIKEDSVFRYYKHSQNAKKSILGDIIHIEGLRMFLNQKIPVGNEEFYDSFLEFLDKL